MSAHGGEIGRDLQHLHDFILGPIYFGIKSILDRRAYNARKASPGRLVTSHRREIVTATLRQLFWPEVSVPEMKLPH